MVAGAPGDDARWPVEPGDLVHGPAQLERPGALKALGLEQDLTAATLGQAARAQHRRVPREARDDLPRAAGFSGRQTPSHGF